MKITCKEASRLMSQSMEGDLPLAQQVLLRLHLAVCDACSHFNRNLKLLREAIRRLA